LCPNCIILMFALFASRCMHPSHLL
jgi:hypothetical protein